MMTLFRELKKIARQLQGSENIFGYKSTVANQIYLLYCFSGNILFTDKIDKRVKYLWYIVVTYQIIVSYSIGLTYFWYMYQHIYDAKKDLMLMFNVVSAFGGIQVVVFGFPLICHSYGDRIETMIEYVDNILTANSNLDISDPKQNQIIIHAKENFRLFGGKIVLFSSLYLSVCCLDLVLFFNEDKAKNYLYYTYPPPLIREYDSFASYFIINGILSVCTAITAFELASVLGILLYWNTICCDELVSICNDLEYGMCDLEISRGSSKVWHSAFEITLTQSVKRLQNVTPLINVLKGFTEAIGSFITLVGFGFGVSCLHVCSSNDLSLVLKMKYLMGYLATGVMIFLFYWIGQNLNNSVVRISFSVYSTPWYESTKIRRHVYIFLCQTQSTMDFVIFKVYGLLLNNFSRYLHGVFSYSNLLRKLTKA